MLPTNHTPLDEATAILEDSIQEGRKTLFIFGIPIHTIATPAEEDAGGKENRPYFTTCYNKDDLGNINIIAYLPEILRDAEVLDASQFHKRTRAGIKEEALHGIQILSVILRYAKLAFPEKGNYDCAGRYYEHIQASLFAELSQTPENRNLLLAAGRLYYANPEINTVAQLHDHDLKYHGREGYITIELIRQILQARQGECLSEEARGIALDRSGKFRASEKEIRALSETIRAYAANPREISPMMAEIIEETEALLLPETPLLKKKVRHEQDMAFN